MNSGKTWGASLRAGCVEYVAWGGCKAGRSVGDIGRGVSRVEAYH